MVFGLEKLFKKDKVVSDEEAKKIEKDKEDVAVLENSMGAEKTAEKMMKGDTASPEVSEEETTTEKNEVEKE